MLKTSADCWTIFGGNNLLYGHRFFKHYPELHVALSAIVCEIRCVNIVSPGFSQGELDYRIYIYCCTYCFCVGVLEIIILYTPSNKENSPRTVAM